MEHLIHEKITFPVVETFVSINGEGQRSGELALFIRFAGCNLCCSYCDTAWANKPGAAAARMSVKDLTALAAASDVADITLTGGEPLLQKDIDVLIQALLEKTDCRIEIETNGSVSIEPWKHHTERLSFTLDYKLPGSGMESHMLTDHYICLLPHDTVKFVCSSRADLDRAEEIIRRYDLENRCQVFLSPVFGRIDPATMVEFLKEKQLRHVRLQLQLHKFIWDPMERGV